MHLVEENERRERGGESSHMIRLHASVSAMHSRSSFVWKPIIHNSCHSSVTI